MTTQVLCFSRSYLAHLFPEIAKFGKKIEFLHLVQTEKERKIVESKGGRVVAVLATEFRKSLRNKLDVHWEEPEDFRSITGYDWDPIISDRHLSTFDEKMQNLIAGSIFSTIKMLFEKFEIKAIIGEPVAIFPSHVLLYFIKKQRGASLLWSGAFFPGAFYFLDRITTSQPVRRVENPLVESKKLFDNMSDYMEGIAQDKAGPSNHHKFAETRAKASNYFNQRKGEKSAVYVSGIGAILIQSGRLTRSILAKGLFPNLFDYMSAASVQEHWFYLKCLLASKNCYDVFPEDYSVDNIFFPVQFEPEASLIYFAPQARNQIEVVEQIARALPHGKLLWVKEHPNQFGCLADSRWLKLKKKYPRLRFVHGRKNGRQLIKLCGLAVAISSTAGMDALILGRKTLVLADVYYRKLKGAIPINGYSDLAFELNNRDNYGTFAFTDELLKGLKPYCDKCFPGIPAPSINLFTKENLEQIARAIESETFAQMAMAGSK